MRASATLLLDFILGERGTEVYEELQCSRPADELGFEVRVPDESFESTDEYSEAFERWSDLFDQLFVSR